MKVGFAKLKFKSSMYKSCLQMFKAHLHSKIKEKAKQSCYGEQVRNSGENRSKSLGAAHWAGGAAHWDAFLSAKRHGHGAYAGRCALGWMHDAHSQRARKLPKLAPIAQNAWIVTCPSRFTLCHCSLSKFDGCLMVFVAW